MEEAVKQINRYHLNPQTGKALTVQKGQIIRVIDVAGGQVSDLICFARQDMDLIVGVTACAAGKCNNYRCTSIAVEIYE